MHALWLALGHLPVRKKLLGLSAVWLVGLLAVLGLTVHLSVQARNIASEECGSLSAQDMAHTLSGVQSICRPLFDGQNQMIDSALRVAAHQVAAHGGLSLSADETAEWTAVNQFSKQSVPAALPKLLLGDRSIQGNKDPSVPGPVVDEVRALTGLHCTLFQRMNPNGDMLRVITTHQTADGRRANGTFIPRTNPDGLPNPVAERLLAGQTYRGRARVLDRWYVTAYQPVSDKTGAVIGAIYVGVPQDGMPGLREALDSVRVGASGRAFVFDGAGEWVFSADPADRGRNLFAAGANDRNVALREAGTKAKALAPGETGELRCSWSDDKGSSDQVVRYVYFAPWDWVIGVSVSQDEVTAAERRVSTAGIRTQLLALGIGLAVVALSLLCAVGVTRSITRPLEQVLDVLEDVARGNLERSVEVHTSDELGRVGGALNVAIGALRQAEVHDRERTEQERKHQQAERERTEREATAERERSERERQQAAETAEKAQQLLGTMSAIAAGDFTCQVPDLGNDVIGQLASALNQTVGSVRAALEGVREVSEQLADASSQLSAASDEISTGAQEQASSLEETASTLHEITATVRRSADSAQQARQLANGSTEVAQKGGRVVSDAVGAMGEINGSSKRIADIITTIDEIAFQTNLLALNAAVEAARAGEQGRGFAVVATEVRNLAQRSATAAKEIKALIQDSVKKVDAGTELVNNSGTTLAEIVSSAKRVADIITEIAAASREQATGIEQVNKAVGQMDSVTQRNASQTEEMSATAQALTDQATQLRDLVARFKLGGTPEPAPRAHKAAKKGRPATHGSRNRSR
ncbi:Cache 3/Cache 2 fusion domain-containing protein [Gemmata sp. JC673]|uniref:Cache 3/Cache 2 fusion domain-containing protein n=1 Tax=Gemmata algarum TaxID=2975278 RepID=A0ABU5F3F3_9BACT|nr:Cache 3/Cache 2 fusion domain-containing protein [Gemmata algarum]MDY3561240.1 Cache 3/Cache 2 fusion domain-containing protein [Gemmata algarum]